MYAPEAESDEDNEVYFLKPVNEYNMVDKIKEANKQLFGDESATSADEAHLNALASEHEPLLGKNAAQKIKITATTSSSNNNNNNGTYRKVTFAPNLEHYAPVNDETAAAQGPVAPAEADSATPTAEPDDERNNNNHKLIDKKKFRCGSIPEEPEHEITEAATARTGSASAPLIDVPTNATADVPTPSPPPPAEDEQVIEEICEEIVLMDIEQEDKTLKPHDTSPTTLSGTRLQRRNTIIKQATFDYDEPDNKSMTNLLNDSNDEDDEYKPEQDASNDDSQHDDLDDLINYSDTDEEHSSHAAVQQTLPQDHIDDEDDEDDDLSLIVASYLPDDFEYATLSEPNTASANGSTKKRSYFSKRFSFRRKVANNNTIGTTCRHIGKHAMSPARTTRAAVAAAAAGLTDYELNDLKLNYKTCCEYRYALLDKLPKYTGYMSEYGLSQQQLEERAHKLKHKKRSAFEQTLRTKEHELRKMQDNERAFTTWLKNKMRYPLNKTRNMFDVKSKQRTANNNINKMK